MAASTSASTPVPFFPWLSNTWKQDAVQRLVTQQLDETQPLALVWNLTAFRRRLHAVQDLFPAHWHHTFACKANPVRAILQTAMQCGVGVECASMGELTLAHEAQKALQGNSGTSPMLFFDCPTKTVHEIKQAMAMPTNIIFDNVQELAEVTLIGEPTNSNDKYYGLRINTEVGAGAIDSHSTSVPWSKFGVPLSQRLAIIDAYRTRPWLNAIHVHVGSQGCTVDLMLQGVRRTVDLALDINRAVGRHQIVCVDLGGGMPVNFRSDQGKDEPEMKAWHDQAKIQIPELFDPTVFARVVTEHGRWYIAKAGLLVSRVEYIKQAGGRTIVLQHAGADVAVRTVWKPSEWTLRCSVVEGKTGIEKTNVEDDVEKDVAGPCCIAGDIVAHRRHLPPVQRGDWIVLHDVGGYYHSAWSAYNSRRLPDLFGYEEAGDAPASVRTLQAKLAHEYDHLIMFR